MHSADMCLPKGYMDEAWMSLATHFLYMMTHLLKAGVSTALRIELVK